LNIDFTEYLDETIPLAAAVAGLAGKIVGQQSTSDKASIPSESHAFKQMYWDMPVVVVATRDAVNFPSSSKEMQFPKQKPPPLTTLILSS
jgi:hypothetical protein